jgi:hypothetical protein
LRAIADGRSLNAALGNNGRAFFDRHYSWPVIERKYVEMLERLNAESGIRRHSEPEAGWFAKRRRTLRPASEVLAELPSGPVVELESNVEAAS